MSPRAGIPDPASRLPQKLHGFRAWGLRAGTRAQSLAGRVRDAAAAAVKSALASRGRTPPDHAGTTGARDPIRQWHEIALRTFIAVGVFSVFVNLLMLTMPIYLFQISDRVLTSRSLDTLVMLSLLALG